MLPQDGDLERMADMAGEEMAARGGGGGGGGGGSGGGERETGRSNYEIHSVFKEGFAAMPETTSFLLLLLFSFFKHASTSTASEFVLNFGKFSGKRLREVPQNYIHWIIREKVYLGKPDLMKALSDMKKLDPPPPKKIAPPPTTGSTTPAPSSQASDAMADAQSQHERRPSASPAPGTIDYFLKRDKT
eukprot:749462-Hanusia_phi.AAC.5